MAHPNAYIRRCEQYDNYRRMNVEIDNELEEKVFNPEYYTIAIFGRSVHTVYTNSHSDVNSWITEIQRRYNAPGQRTIGLDIKVINDFTDRLHPPLSTIQVSINDECLIYHMYLSDKLPRGLQRFLTDPKNVFLGINLEDELFLLKYWTQYRGHICFRDLAVLAFPGAVPMNAGITEVTAQLLRQDLVLPEVDPDWDFHTLTDDQIIYACAVAYLSYRIGHDTFPDT